jgi:alcohol dehydrogenase (cytochrome c)
MHFDLAGRAGMTTALLVIALTTLGCDRNQGATATNAAATGPGPASSPAARSAPSSVGNWISYNGSLAGDRYSRLTEIDTSNVNRLHQVCAFDTPDTVSFQTGLVAVEGTLFFTAFGNTYAIDGATCQQKWKHSRSEPDTFLKVNRGVGYGDGRVFRGTGDGHVLALDAATGAVVWDVTIADPKKGESIPMAPVAWNGLVFIGNAGGDNFGVTGRVYGLDASSGRTVWQFNTIPESGPARATWEKASTENPPTGGATWTTYAVDEANGVLYVTTGNPAPDFAEQLHPGDNLYSNSVLALEAKTGKLIAYVQPIKGDFHDWDVSAGPALITTKAGHPFIAAAAKDGYIYGIDRGLVKNAAGTEPDARALVVRSKGLTTTRENADAPLMPDRMTRFCPGSQGGIEWNGPTYAPDLGLVFANSIHWCTSVKLQPIEKMKGAPGMPWTGMDHPELAFGQQDPTDRWNGFVTAVNPDDGQVRWQVKTPKPMVAGITATAGGLVFTGDLDGNALAYDAHSGKELWRQATGKPIGGGVISYEAGGAQRVAVAGGLNSPIWPIKGGTARVTVYSLR